MGFRTVVVLSNDQMHNWENDPELGKKIADASHYAMGSMNEDDKRRAHFGYGKVVESAHADLHTLAVIEGYGMNPIGYASWGRDQTDEQKMMALLQSAAEQLGYKLTKKPAPKPKKAFGSKPTKTQEAPSAAPESDALESNGP